MTAISRPHLAFHLGAVPPAPELDPIRGRDLLPALFARYRDLASLRYDFPVVLLEEGDAAYRPLSSILDDVLAEIGEDDPLLARHVLDLEAEIRALSARGDRGTLSELWDRAAARYAGRSEPRRQSLDRARAALALDGDVVDCDAHAADRIVRHVWRRAEIEKARRFRAQAASLAGQLSEILRAAFMHSEAGRHADQLKSSFGSGAAGAFDFEAMARILGTSSPAFTIDDARRRRLHTLVAGLTMQLFYPAEGQHGLSFEFDSCVAALRAWNDRLPKLADLAQTLAIAELEAAGEYDEARHGAYFEQLAGGAIALDPRDVALFPDYFVRLDAAAIDPVERDALLDILASDLPIKVLVESADILPEPAHGPGRDAGARVRQLGRMAIGLASARVIQTPASHLVPLGAPIASAVTSPGPALFSVFTGASPAIAGLPPYLVAAAALESRVFPAFAFEPASDGGSPTLDVSVNPQPEADWPEHDLAYEDDAHAAAAERIGFTAADFMCCDRRYARHFARVGRDGWTEDMIPAARWLGLDAASRRGRIPSLWLIDADNRLQRAIADETIAREARVCLERWHGLRQLSRPQARPAAPETIEPPAVGAAPAESAPAAASETPASAVPGPAAPSGAEAAAPGEPYIETPRCSTCNECVQLNGRMFQYNANRQAYIADPNAGTFRELVEAAESCQVSIIHPGIPKNPDEPGLDDLVRRAELFG